MHKNHIFREYDIRGVYEKDFDTHFAQKLGRAFVAYLQNKQGDTPTLSVGYDARLSSPIIAQSLIQGMTSSGAKVFNLGLITTPMSYFSMFQMNLSGGIMVTGSHNPPEYNGFKISVGTTTIFGEQIQELKSILDSGKFPQGAGAVESYDIAEEYIQRYAEEFSSTRPISVVLDCGNGAAGAIVRKLYQGSGIDADILFEEPDGTFPNHHPDPTIEENMFDVKKRVLESGAQLGIGFDGDADRIGVVDEKGRFILGDEIMMIVARDLLQNPQFHGEKIIGDVKCSDRLYQDIEKNGG